MEEKLNPQKNHQDERYCRIFENRGQEFRKRSRFGRTETQKQNRKNKNGKPKNMKGNTGNQKPISVFLSVPTPGKNRI
ncbi:MAG: hypothetical protein II955_07250 [Clostridia bacterium]|nr:hypothetical protein [Clostridia bacterium]